MAGTIQSGAVLLDSAVIITLASDVLTPTQATIKVAAQSGTADDLVTINTISGVSVPFLLLLQADAGDTITVRRTGNIKLTSGDDETLTGDRVLLLLFDGTNALDVTPAPFATYSTANVANPPTDAELDSAFGAPSVNERGRMWLLNDAGAGTNEYLATTDGTNWLYATLTKAV